MKLALFFFLSLAVHVTAFLVPVSFNRRASDRSIVVTILPLESASEPSGSAGKPPGESRAYTAKSVKANSINRSGATALSPAPMATETAAVEAATPTTDKIVTSITGVSAASLSNNSGEVSAPGFGAGGNNSLAGRLGAGSGNGSGNGEGSGTAQAGVTLTEARYRETPQPQYPDSARRAGKEGRVLLRVLVDEDGKAKAIEVNSSSGHDTLDRAATEALKKWRFVPAQAGGKPVETWVKVPIEFQLSNAK